MTKIKKMSHKEVVVNILRSETFVGNDCNEAIVIIKKNRLYMDLEIRQLLFEVAHRNSEVERFNKEVEVIQGIDDELQEKIKAIGESFESPQDELSHTMWVFELLQRHSLSLPSFDGFELKIERSFIDEGNFKSKFYEINSQIHFVSYFSVVFKSILNRIERPSTVMLTAEKLQAAGRHLTLASEWEIFRERRAFWEHSCTLVSQQGSDIIFDSSNDLLVSAFRVSLSRLRAFRVARSLDKLNYSGVRRDTRLMPLEEFKSKGEVVSCYLTSLQFYSETLMEVVYGVSLSQWIRAYTILKELALKYIFSKNVSGDVNAILFRGSRDYFVESMREGGLADKVAQVIIKHFTFGKSSKDILDAPLFEDGMDFVFIPTVTAMIEPAFSLESLIRSIKNQKNHELAIIGPGLERNLKNDLNDAGFVAKNLKFKNFDCDIAFIIDDVLFLCECKGKYQVSDFFGYVDLESYLQKDAVAQHIRTCNFFERNLQHIRREFNLSPEWVPKNIIRLIITSAKLGRAILKHDFIIVDENIFHGFFSRKSPRMIDRDGMVVQVFHDPRLIGKITVENFLSYVSSPPTVSRHAGFKMSRDVSFKIKSGNVLFRDVECYGEVEMHST